MNRSEPNSKQAGFTSRWSRRKQAAKQQDLANVPVQDTVEEDALIRQAQNEAQIKADELKALNALTDADMPEVESLDENSDFAQFMSTSVSEGLRKLALRKLFHGEAYNVRDGLDEYDGDYTFFEKLDPNTITSDMRHMIEVEAQKQKRLEEEALAEQALLQEDESQPKEDEVEEQPENEDSGMQTVEQNVIAVEQNEDQISEHQDEQQAETPSEEIST